jgi:hypothetical protein
MTKQIIIGILAIALLGGGYYYFTTMKEEGKGTLDTKKPGLLGNSSGDNPSQPIGADVLSLLNRISSLKIDTEIFDSLIYQSLVDYSVEIPPQEVGRPNPFAPIQGGASAGQAAPAGIPRQ